MTALLVPANILNLNNFKLTLPTGVITSPPQSGVPTEIHQQELTSYSDPYFYRRGSGVIFNTPVGGVVQKGSKYPRTELREMLSEGQTLASWSPSVGRHTMTLVQQVLNLPLVKPEVVIGQIHDANGFVLLLWVTGNHDGTANLIARGINGIDTPIHNSFDITNDILTSHIEAVDGAINIGDFNMPWTTGGCYFKTGCYVQSNLSHDTADQFGAVLTRNLSITHE